MTFQMSQWAIEAHRVPWKEVMSTTTAFGNARRYIPVQVPEEHFAYVLGYIATQDGFTPIQQVDATDTTTGGSTSPEPVTQIDESPSGNATPTLPWTTEELRRLSQSTYVTTEVVSKVMDVLSPTPGTWRNIGQLSETTGVERSRLQHIWTHLSRHISKAYPNHDWPLESRWGTDIEGAEPGIAYYRVSAERAAEWQLIRGI